MEPLLPANLDDLKKLAKPEPWLSKIGLVIVVLFFLTLSVTTAPLIDLNADPSSGNAAVNTLARFGYVIALPLAMGICWLGVTQAYLRTGKGIKVGLVDTLTSGQVKEWSEAREVLADLVNRGQLRDKVSLRLVPRTAVRSETRLNNFISRYKFDLVLQIQGVTKGKEKNVSFTVLNEDVLQNEWMSATMSHLAHLLKQRKGAYQPHEASRIVARSIQEAIIWLAAARYVSLQQLDDAIPLLRLLDSRLESAFTPDERPRPQIRWLIKACYISPTVFKIDNDLPSPESLEKFENRIALACNFDPTDAGPFTVLARIQFLRGNIPNAINSVNRAEEIAGDKHQNLVICIDNGFLNLISSKFDKSAKAYSQLLDCHDVLSLDWSDLTAFADLCAEWNHPHVIFIRDLYRRLGDITIPKEISDEASKWLDEDESRASLRKIRNRATEVRRKLVMSSPDHQQKRKKRRNSGSQNKPNRKRRRRKGR